MTAPPAEQTSSSDCGFTTGEAIDTPSAKANHASMRRGSKAQVRKVYMARIIVHLVRGRAGPACRQSTWAMDCTTFQGRVHME